MGESSEAEKQIHKCEHRASNVENSVYWSQTGRKRKKCDTRTWKKRLFLYISPTNFDTFVPSLYQCVETRNTEVFGCCLSHFRTWSGIIYD
jgi:hypothetical protein